MFVGEGERQDTGSFIPCDFHGGLPAVGIQAHFNYISALFQKLTCLFENLEKKEEKYLSQMVKSQLGGEMWAVELQKSGGMTSVRGLDCIWGSGRYPIVP